MMYHEDVCILNIFNILRILFHIPIRSKSPKLCPRRLYHILDYLYKMIVAKEIYFVRVRMRDVQPVVKTDCRSVLSLGRRSASGELFTKIPKFVDVKSKDNSVIMNNENAPYCSKSTLDQYCEWIVAIDKVVSMSSTEEQDLNDLLNYLQKIRNRLIGNIDAKTIFLSQHLPKRFFIPFQHIYFGVDCSSY